MFNYADQYGTSSCVCVCRDRSTRTLLGFLPILGKGYTAAELDTDAFRDRSYEVVQQALGGEDFMVGDNGQLERIEKRVIRATDVTADGVRTLRNDIAKTQKGVNEVGSSVLAVHETAKDIREQL